MGKKKQNSEPDPRIGALVRYYRGGWHHGYLKEIKGKEARILPIVGYKAAAPRCVIVPATEFVVEVAAKNENETKKGE